MVMATITITALSIIGKRLAVKPSGAGVGEAVGVGLGEGVGSRDSSYPMGMYFSVA